MKKEDPTEVQRPTHPKFLERLAGLRATLPEATEHLAAFQALGAEYTFIDRAASTATKSTGHGAWRASVKFSAAVEANYGITREVLAYYLPYSDLQNSVIDQLRYEIGAFRLESGRDLEPDIAFVFSLDPSLEHKAEEWSSPGLTLLPLPVLSTRISEASRRILDIMRNRLFRRDLYFETLPVEGDKFFGRRLMVEGLITDLRNSFIPGVFGLRKAGKTSIVKRVGYLLERSRTTPTAFIFKDLEDLPSPPEDPVPQLVRELRQYIHDLAKEKRLSRDRLPVHSPGMSDLELFKRDLDALCRYNPNLKFVIALDEVEVLVPPDPRLRNDPRFQGISIFLGTLRALVQEHKNLTFMVSGMTSLISESGMLYGRNNPIFSLTKPYLIGPFVPEEERLMLTDVGRKLGMQWDEYALEELRRHSGGYPFLSRTLASTVAKALPVGEEFRLVHAGDVTDAISDWRFEQADHLEFLITSLDMSYPVEAELFRLLIQAPDEFNSQKNAQVSALRHLVQMGLISRTGQNYVPNQAIRKLIGV